jgi:hypothetical protein
LSPRHAARLVMGTWAHNPNAMCGTHARGDTATRRDTTVVLRDRGQRCPGAACATCNNHHPSRH